MRYLISLPVCVKQQISASLFMSFFLTAKLYHDILHIVSNLSDIGFASIQSIFGHTRRYSMKSSCRKAPAPLLHCKSTLKKERKGCRLLALRCCYVQMQISQQLLNLAAISAGMDNYV